MNAEIFSLSTARQTNILSGVAVLMSFLLTGALYLVTLGMNEGFWDAMTLAVVVPWAISIPLSWLMVQQHQKLRDASARLEETRIELEDVNRQLLHKANFDGLTGLSNREHFIKLFDERRKKSENNVLMIIDADHFKDINDGYGHPVGDKALILLASVFRRILRKHDLVGRIGGEEFGILLPDTVEAEGEIIGEMIRHEIENIKFEPQPDVPHRITVSIGLTGVSPAEERAIPMRNADSALFAAKRNGRNQCMLYRSGMRTKPRPLYEDGRAARKLAVGA